MKSRKYQVTNIKSDGGENMTSLKAKQGNPQSSHGNIEEGKTEANHRQLNFLVNTVNFLSAGIGNKRRSHCLGCAGLVLWIFHNVVHFGLDFYEARFVFHVSWASTVALFLIAVVLCSINSIKYSVPWFIRGVQKLSIEGTYDKTLRRICTYYKVVRIAIIPLSVAAAVIHFICYAHDGALGLDFKDGSSSNRSAPEETVPGQLKIILNIFRATSLVHICYGFWFFLLTELGTIYMIKSSMEEYTEYMAKVLRQTPVVISLSEAVHSFAARSRFVHSGSVNSTGVLVVLLIVGSASFVLNAYNYLFLRKYAIYFWFALAPVPFVVLPLIGAAWVTRHYQKYKLVVVNAWVDVPDEEDNQDDEKLQDDPDYFRKFSRTFNLDPGISRYDKNHDQGQNSLQGSHVKKKDLKENEMVEGGNTNGKKSVTGSQSFSYKPNIWNGSSNKKSHCSNKTGDQKRRTRSMSDLPSPVCTSLLADPNVFHDIVVPSQNKTFLSPKPTNKKNSFQGVNVADATSITVPNVSGFENKAYREDEDNETRIPITESEAFQPPQTENTDPEEGQEEIHFRNRDSELMEKSQGSRLFSGIVKTFSRWRSRVKAKRKFNFEKYITYLDSTLPTVGFAIGGVVITWAAVSGFCFLLFTLVEIFIQEAFFGK